MIFFFKNLPLENGCLRKYKDGPFVPGYTATIGLCFWLFEINYDLSTLCQVDNLLLALKILFDFVLTGAYLVFDLANLQISLNTILFQIDRLDLIAYFNSLRKVVNSDSELHFLHKFATH